MTTIPETNHAGLSALGPAVRSFYYNPGRYNGLIRPDMLDTLVFGADLVIRKWALSNEFIDKTVRRKASVRNYNVHIDELTLSPFTQS